MVALRSALDAVLALSGFAGVDLALGWRVAADGAVPVVQAMRVSCLGGVDLVVRGRAATGWAVPVIDAVRVPCQSAGFVRAGRNGIRARHPRCGRGECQRGGQRETELRDHREPPSNRTVFI